VQQQLGKGKKISGTYCRYGTTRGAGGNRPGVREKGVSGEQPEEAGRRSSLALLPACPTEYS